MTREEKLARLKELKALEKVARKTAEQAKADREMFEAALFDEMEATNTYAQRQGGTNYVLKSTIFGNITDRDAFRDWCEATGQAEELLREVEEKQRLNEIVRAAIDNNEELPPGVGFFAKRYISVTEKN
jgi:hypothetical protein